MSSARVNMSARYAAFISYSHAADGQLAPALQAGLQGFAKPLFRLRALRVFRDKTGLGVTAALWPAIESALADADYFVLLASPGAARSPWVDREVDWWLTHRSAAKLLIVWTDGDIVRSVGAPDFDWQRTDALPARLRGVFTEEPFILDLRWARRSTDFSPRQPGFQEAIARIAATLRRQPFDELIGDDVRQHRRFRRFVTLGVAAVVAFAVVATWQAFVARREELLAKQATRTSELERRHALAETATALAPRPGRFPAALVKAMEAWAGSSDAATDPTIADAVRDLAGSAVVSRPLAMSETEDGARWPSVPRGTGTTAVSDDGASIFVVGGDGKGRVWDAASGRLLATLAADGVRGARFSTDSGTLVTFGARYQLWRLPAASSAASIAGEPDDERADAMLGSDGKVLYTLDSVGLRLWDAARGAPVATPDADDPQAGTAHPSMRLLAFAPDGRRLVASEDGGTIRVHDVATGKIIARLRGHGDSVSAAAFLHDGSRLVTAADDGTVRLWDMARAAPLAVQRSFSRFAAFAAGDLLLTADQDALRIWDDSLQSIVRELRPGGAVALSRDGRRVVVGSEDGVARVREVENGEAILTLDGHGQRLAHVAFLGNDESVLTVEAGGAARVWDLQRSGRTALFLQPYLRGIRAGSFAVEPTSDGRFLACGLATAVWRRRQDGVDVREFEIPGGCTHAEWAVGDATFVMDGGRDVRLVDAHSGRVLWREESASLHGLSADRTRFWTWERRSRLDAGTRKFVDTYTLRMWSALDGRPLGEASTKNIDEGALYVAAVADDGARWLVGGSPAQLRDARDPGKVVTLPWKAPVPSAAFDAGGDSLVLIAADGSLRRLSAVTGEVLATVALWSGGERRVTGVVDAADGSALLVKAEDGDQLLDARSLVVRCRWPGGHVLAWGEARAPGTKRAVVELDSGAQVWDTARCTAVARLPRPADDDLVSASLSPDGGAACVTDWSGRALCFVLDPARSFAFACRVLAGFPIVPGADEKEVETVRAACAAAGVSQPQ